MAPTKKLNKAAKASAEKALKGIQKKKEKRIIEKLSGKNYSPVVENFKTQELLAKLSASVVINKKGKTGKAKDQISFNLPVEKKSVKIKKDTPESPNILQLAIKGSKRKHGKIEGSHLPVSVNSEFSCDVPEKSKKKAAIIKSSGLVNTTSLKVPLVKAIKATKNKETVTKPKKIKIVPVEKDAEVQSDQTVKVTKALKRQTKKISENSNELKVETVEIITQVAPTKKIGKKNTKKVIIANLKQKTNGTILRKMLPPAEMDKVNSNNDVVDALAKTEPQDNKIAKKNLKKDISETKSIANLKPSKKIKMKQPEEEIENSNEIKEEVIDSETTTLSPKKKIVKKKLKTESIGSLKPISNIKTLKKGPPPLKQGKKSAKKYPNRGVCYFSHLPHGFYGEELEKYCSQFGKVTGVYHPVSKRGNSRGYAFVEFQHKEVAEVVAETMNNYLMFNRLLKCEYVPPERQKPRVFKRNKDNKMLADERREKALSARMKALSIEEENQWKKRKTDRVKLLHKKLSQLGVDYKFQVNDGVKEEEASDESL